MSQVFTPDDRYQQLAEQLAEDTRRWHRAGSQVIGVSGAQGTGKSTLCEVLSKCLTRQGLRVAQLSLDDFYLTRAERKSLSRVVHPLLATRGVPGTHDVELGMVTILALLMSGRVSIPRFTKAIDDRAPESEWPMVEGPVDLVLFEGWCLGVVPEEEDPSPLNAVEAEHDADGKWRQFIEEQLAGEYRLLFDLVDRWIYLDVPSFGQVHAWRRQQEIGNAAKVAGATAMSDAALLRFISHYERLTRRAMRQLPQLADVTVKLLPDHCFGEISYKGEDSSRQA